MILSCKKRLIFLNTQLSVHFSSTSKIFERAIGLPLPRAPRIWGFAGKYVFGDKSHDFDYRPQLFILEVFLIVDHALL